MFCTGTAHVTVPASEPWRGGLALRKPNCLEAEATVANPHPLLAPLAGRPPTPRGTGGRAAAEMRRSCCCSVFPKRLVLGGEEESRGTFQAETMSEGGCLRAELLPPGQLVWERWWCASLTRGVGVGHSRVRTRRNKNGSQGHLRSGELGSRRETHLLIDLFPCPFIGRMLAECLPRVFQDQKLRVEMPQCPAGTFQGCRPSSSGCLLLLRVCRTRKCPGCR